jgi:hypothetical protein
MDNGHGYSNSGSYINPTYLHGYTMQVSPKIQEQNVSKTTEVAAASLPTTETTYALDQKQTLDPVVVQTSPVAPDNLETAPVNLEAAPDNLEAVQVNLETAAAEAEAAAAAAQGVARNVSVANNDDRGEDSLLDEIFDRLKSLTKRVSAEMAQAIRTRTRIENSKTFTPTGQVSLEMVNNSRSYDKSSFFDDVKSNSLYKQVKKSNMSQDGFSDNVKESISDFIRKMKIRLDLSGYELKCVLELHDTIDRTTTSEKIGDRCNALNIFVAMIKAIKDYINSNNSEGNPYAGKLFNFPIEVTFSDSMFGSGFRKSYKACNGGNSLFMGGSRSRRKPVRKTRRGRTRKSKSKSKTKTKTHRRRRHSRVRKNKKYTSRRR